MKNFDEEFTCLITEIVQKAFEYINNDSNSIDYIYIYCSLEWNVFFQVFYKGDNKLVKKNKINDISMNKFDVSESKQRELNIYCNDLLQKIKDLFVQSKRVVPTQIKMSYVTKTGKFESKMSYGKFHNDELFIGDAEVAEDWFDELQNRLHD